MFVYRPPSVSSFCFVIMLGPPCASTSGVQLGGGHGGHGVHRVEPVGAPLQQHHAQLQHARGRPGPGRRPLLLLLHRVRLQRRQATRPHQPR